MPHSNGNLNVTIINSLDSSTTEVDAEFRAQCQMSRPVPHPSASQRVHELPKTRKIKTQGGKEEHRSLECVARSVQGQKRSLGGRNTSS
nr:hypothetical protein CFP56_71241 [Quercus suber]